MYLGELRRAKAIIPLSFETFLLRTCDDQGSLKKISAENYVQVEAIPVKDENNEDALLLTCLECNKCATSAKDCLSKGKVKKETISKFEKFCIHTVAVKKINPKKYMENSHSEKSENDNDSQIISEDPHIAVCYSNKKYGIVYCDLKRGGKRGKCITCKSINCGHAKLWNTVERPGRVKEPVKVSNKEKENDKEKAKEGMKEDNRYENKPEEKLSWPPKEEDQGTFKRLAEEGHQYQDLTDMVPRVGKKKACDHGHEWSKKCPKKQGWIDSTNIKILHSSWIKDKGRISYYREAEGCPHKCRLQFRGEEHFLLNMSSVYSNGKAVQCSAVQWVLSPHLLK
jgi:hypothetical protein